MANPWDSDPVVAASPVEAALQAEGTSGPKADFVRSLYQQETSGGKNTATSNAGAVGDMQITPPTFAGVADKGWNINDPVHNARAGVRYASQMYDKAGGNPAIAAAGYYGGPGGLAKAQQGIAVSDPRNPGAPNTLQYGAQVAGRMPAQGNPWDNDPVVPQQEVAQTAAVPAVVPTTQASAVPQQSSQPPQQVSFLDRVAKGINDPLDAGLQVISHALPTGVLNALNSANSVLKMPAIGPLTQNTQTLQQLDQNITNQEKQYQTNRIASGSKGFDAARMLGNVVGAAPLAIAAPAGGGLVAGAATGAALGAANGALTPVNNVQSKPSGVTDLVTGQNTGNDFWSQKLNQIGLGALAGGLAAPVANMAGRAIAGAGGAAQRMLADAGVTMTPGQILGGALARTEEKLSSVPVLGDFIKNAQQRSVQSFNNATYNQVLAPLGQRYEGQAGTEGVEAVRQQISHAYDSALSRMNFTARDPQFNADITNLGSMAANLPTAQAQTFANVLRTQIFGKLGPQGTMDGQALKGVQSELSRIARGYAGDPSFDNRQLGAAIGEIRNAVDASLARTNPEAAVQQLNNANTAYANYVRLRSAAGSMGAGNNGGVFTAGQLNSAVRANDRSTGKGAFATGNALMQDFSTAGQDVLGSKYPNSGTPGRSAMMLAIPALAGHAFLPPAAIPAVAAAGGLAALPYTGVGGRIAQSILMSRPAAAQQIGQGISQYSNALAPAPGAALLNGSNR
jgi:hypothetical protein